MTVLGSLLKSRPKALSTWGDDWNGGGSTTWAGQNVSASTALQQLTVYGCNRFIADGISTLPVQTFRKTRDGSPDQIANDAIIVAPAPGLDFISWSSQVLTSLLMAGNAYLLMGYQGGALTSMVPIDPTKVSVTRENGRRVYHVAGRQLSSFQIGHITGVMWPGTDVGMSPLEAARQTIGQGMSAQEYGSRFFGQGASLSGVIEVPGTLEDGAARAMAKNWARDHSGPNKSNLPGVLEGGAAWKPTGITNEQSQFLETRKFSASEIAAQMFLIDPAEMGLPVDGSSLTYANLEQRNARKVQVTFLPWIKRVEMFLSALLPRPQYVKLNVDGLLRGDTKTRYESYAIGIDKGFLTVNESRAFEERAPLADPSPTPPGDMP